MLGAAVGSRCGAVAVRDVSNRGRPGTLVPIPQERVGGPYVQEDFPDGVKAFYDAGTLACVALDAVIGPQVFLSGFPLTGSDPEQGQQFLLDHAAEHGKCLLHTPDDSLSLADLGVLSRSQQVGATRLTRPLFVKEEGLESHYFRDHLPLEGCSG